MENQLYDDIKLFLSSNNLPAKIKSLHLSGQYRFKNIANKYKLQAGKLFSIDTQKEILPLRSMPQKVDQVFQQSPFGPKKVHDLVKENGISRTQVTDYINRQESYQLHRAMPQQRIVKLISSSKFGGRLQIDLVDMSKYFHSNRGMHWILTIVDIHSRFGWAIPIRNKQAQTVFDALKPILLATKCEILQSDNGSEFSNGILDAFCAQNNIKQIKGSPYYPQTNGSVERFNGTIKRLIWRYFTMYKTTNWVDQIDDILANYNNSIHSTTGTKPITHSSVKDVPAYRIIGDISKLTTLSVGQKVRISLRTDSQYRKQTFKKRYTQNWSKEIFKISAVSGNYFYALQGKSGLYGRTDLLPIPDDTIPDISIRNPPPVPQVIAPPAPPPAQPPAPPAPVVRPIRNRRMPAHLADYVIPANAMPRPVAPPVINPPPVVQPPVVRAPVIVPPPVVQPPVIPPPVVAPRVQPPAPPARPQRNRRAPAYLSDYVVRRE